MHLPTIPIAALLAACASCSLPGALIGPVQPASARTPGPASSRTERPLGVHERLVRNASRAAIASRPEATGIGWLGEFELRRARLLSGLGRPSSDRDWAFLSLAEELSGREVDGLLVDVGLPDGREWTALQPLTRLADGLGLDLPPVEFSTQGAGLGLDDDAAASTFFDAEALGRWRLETAGTSVAGHLAAGYRFSDLSLEYEDAGEALDTNQSFRGPWLGLTVSL